MHASLAVVPCNVHSPEFGANGEPGLCSGKLLALKLGQTPREPRSFEKTRHLWQKMLAVNEPDAVPLTPDDPGVESTAVFFLWHAGQYAFHSEFTEASCPSAVRRKRRSPRMRVKLSLIARPRIEGHFWQDQDVASPCKRMLGQSVPCPFEIRGPIRQLANCNPHERFERTPPCAAVRLSSAAPVNGSHAGG